MIGYSLKEISTRLNTGQIPQVAAGKPIYTQEEVNGAIGNINSPLLDMPLKNSLAMKSGGGSATFTRASTATYIDRYGVLKSAVINEPRFEKEGYLNEGASTNLLTYSEDFSNASWSFSANTTVVVDSIAAPNGNTSADTLTKTANSFAVKGQGVVGAIGSYTASVFVKAGTFTKMTLAIANGDNNIVTRALFDLSTETLTAQIGTVSNCNFKKLSDGWYFVSVIGSITVANPQIRIYPDDATLAIAGDIYIWGAQLEALPFATSYIPTTDASITRAADNLTLSANGNYNIPADKKTIILDYDILGCGTGYQTLFDLTGTSQYNRIMSFVPTTTTPNQRPVCYYSGNTMGFGNSAVPANTKNRLAYLLPSGTATQSVTRYLNGVFYAADSQTITANLAPTTLYIGRSNVHLSSNHFGHISNIRVYDKALSSTEVALA